MVALAAGLGALVFAANKGSGFPREGGDVVEYDYRPRASVLRAEDVAADLLDAEAYLSRLRRAVESETRAVHRLREERAALEPVVRMGRDTVATWVAYQNVRDDRRWWRSQAQGLVIGVISGLLASALLWTARTALARSSEDEAS